MAIFRARFGASLSPINSVRIVHLKAPRSELGMSAETKLTSGSPRSPVVPGQASKVGWPADHVERWPIDRLIPYARNARTHTDTQVAQIAASIAAFGWTAPALIDD